MLRPVGFAQRQRAAGTWCPAGHPEVHFQSVFDPRARELKADDRECEAGALELG